MTAALTPTVRVVTPADTGRVDAVLASDPVANVFPAARIQAARRDGNNGQLWAFGGNGDAFDSLCYAGANLVPIRADERAAVAFAQQAAIRGRTCSSMVGPSEAVLTMWRQLESSWGRAREIRPRQPVLAAVGQSTRCQPDPTTRVAVLADLPALFPAAVAMYTEEVGLSPLLGDGGTAFRVRLSGLVRAGHVFLKKYDDQVIFKAEIGSVALGACQVQGVWTHPHWRGRGIATAAMATVTAYAQAHIAPVVSLYVNDFNIAARRVYDSCGFVKVGNFATVLF